MKRAFIGPLLALIAGCGGGHEDRDALLRLLKAIEKNVSAKNRDQDLKPYAGEERKIRFFAQDAADMLSVVRDFLASRPKLSDRAREAVQQLHDAALQRAKLYEALVNEKRYVLTDAEMSQRDESWAQLLRAMNKIGAIADGE